MSPVAPGVTILTWHSIAAGRGPTRIAPATFRDQVQAIADAGSTVVGLAAVGRWVDGAGAMPPRAVVVTFDDGFENFATDAWPALGARAWPSTLFVCAGRIGARSDWPGSHAQPLLDWARLRDLAAGGVEIGSHALTHRDLTGLPAAEADMEVADSQRILADGLRRPVGSFAYPFGRSTPSLRRAVASRYAVAAGIAMRRAARDDDRYDLPRVDMTYFRAPDRLRRFLADGASAWFTVRRVLRRAGQVVRG